MVVQEGGNLDFLLLCARFPPLFHPYIVNSFLKRKANDLSLGEYILPREFYYKK